MYDQDPLLAAPAVPDTSSPSLAQLDTILAGFEIASGSPAIDAGPDVVGMDGHPDWHPGRTDTRWDLQGDARPEGGAWDLGADER